MGERLDPPDRIHIRDLRLRCILGVHERERRAPREVVINITLYTDLRRAGASDRVEDTIDYACVSRRVGEVVEGSAYFLVERLAERVAEVCLELPAVRRVRVLVEKPAALPRTRTVGVEIVRSPSRRAGRGGGDE